MPFRSSRGGGGGTKKNPNQQTNKQKPTKPPTMKGQNVPHCELTGNFFSWQISWSQCSGYWMSITNNMAYATVHCNKIPFSKFSCYWAPCHFNTQYLRKAYIFASSMENMLLFTVMFAAKKPLHLCTGEVHLSEMNKLYCTWNTLIASTTLQLQHSICGADNSVRVSLTSPVPFFKSAWCWKQVTICLGFPRYI